MSGVVCVCCVVVVSGLKQTVVCVSGVVWHGGWAGDRHGLSRTDAGSSLAARGGGHLQHGLELS